MGKPLEFVLGILAFAIGAAIVKAITYYLGVSSFLIALLLVMSYFFVQRFLKIKNYSLKWAVIIQITHSAWMLIGFVILCIQGYTLYLDSILLFILIAGIIWIILVQNQKAPAVVLIIYQLIMLTINGSNLYSMGLKTSSNGSLMLHIFLRIMVIFFLAKHVLKIRSGEENA
jgi:hypothetical protein